MHGCPNRTSGLNRGKKLLPLPLPGIDTVIQLIVVVVFFFLIGRVYLALGWLKMLDACFNFLAAEAQASDSVLACGTGKLFPEALLEMFSSL